MARFVVFNGITLVHPGGLSKVDVSALAQTGVGVTGIIGVIGESDGGFGAPRTLINIDDPTVARSTFRSGPLADAIRLAFEPTSDTRIPGGAFRVVCYKTNLSTQSTITLNDALANPMLTLTSKEYGAEANQITFSFSQDPVTSTQYQTVVTQGATREVTTNIGGKPLMSLEFKGPEEPLYVTGAWGTTTGAGTVTQIADTNITAATTTDMYVRITSGVTAGEIRPITTVTPGASFEVCGGVAAEGFSGVPGAGVTYEILTARVVEGTLDAVPTNVTNATVNVSPDLGGARRLYSDDGTSLIGMLFRVTSGIGQGQIRKITGQALAAGAGTDTILTLDGTFDNVPESGDSFAIIDCTAGTASVAGSSGLATTLTTTTTMGSGAAVNLGVTLAGKTITDIVSEINAVKALASQPTAGGFYNAIVGPGRNGSLSAQLFDFDPANQTVDIRIDSEVSIASANLRDDLNLLVNSINANSSLITAARNTSVATAGSRVPSFFPTSSPAALAGAARGTSTNSDWQNGFDELLKTRINIVVPLISDDLSEQGLGSTATVDAVIAQLASHVNTAKGVGRNERNAYASINATDLDDALTTATDLNNPNVSLVYQRPTVLNIESNLVQQDAWAHAMLAAGMQAGSPVGEPLTYKFVKANQVTQPASLDPLDRTISNQLLLGGVMFTEFIEGKGHRWVRGLTSYLTDDNLAFTDISVNEVLNFVSYELRTGIEDRFTGTKALPATVMAIKSFIEGLLENYRRDEIIVDSFDVTSGAAVKAYHDITVTVSGDIANIKVSIFPVTGINYELLELFAQLPVISA